MDKIAVDWDSKTDNNNGFIYGIEHQDHNGNVIDVEWFKSEEERDREVIMDKKIMKTRVISSKEDWIRMDREEVARKECKLNKKKPFTRFQWLLISLGFKGVK